MSTDYKFYSLNKILTKNAQYNIIIGERSNGKTYACLKYGIEQFVKTGKQTAIVRRWKEDIRTKRTQHMYDALVSNGEILDLTGGEWSTIQYYSGAWYLANYDEKLGYIKDAIPVAIPFALSDVEHDKSTAYPNITTIVFDEFLTRGAYLQDEFIIFMNTLSTIIRDRNDVKIFMLGNTVNKYSPYFKELGLSHITAMKQGTIDVYRYGDSTLKVAVEYCKPYKKSKKKSDVYFAFDNPKLEMIKSGTWEIDIYPHLTIKYKPENVQFIFFIVFNDLTFQCEVVAVEMNIFCYIHRKTTDLKYKSRDIVYNGKSSENINLRYSFCKPIDTIDSKVLKLFTSKRIFYQDNEVGEAIKNFMIQTGGVTI